MCEAREDQRSKIHEIDSLYKVDILPPLLFSSHTTHTHTHHYLLLRPVTVRIAVKIREKTQRPRDHRCQDTKEERERESKMSSEGKVTQWKTVTKTEIVDGQRKITTIRTRTTTKTNRSDGITIAGKPRRVYKQNDHSIFAQFSGKSKKNTKKTHPA